MDKLHDKLMDKKGWYHFWHSHKGSQVAHWAVFVLVGLLFTGLIVARIENVGLLAKLQGLNSKAAATAPELPRVFLDTHMSVTPVTGASHVVPTGSDARQNGANLQAVLDSANLGDEIVLTAGAIYWGPITLPNKTTGSGWITVRTSNMSGIPAEGSRVSPTHAAAMPKILTPSLGELYPNGGYSNPGFAAAAVLSTATAAHHYRIIGVEFGTTSAVTDSYDLVSLNVDNVTSLTQLPHDLIFDRVYIHGVTNGGTKRGILLNSAATAIVDSYISKSFGNGLEAQAIAGFNGPGPYKIVNNYLEAGSENVMFGGADPTIANLVPSDIEFRKNLVAKDLAWKNASPSFWLRI